MIPKETDPVEVVRQITAVPSILDIVCSVTGMGFAVVARVTDDQWVACEVMDKIDFGLKPGDELRIETTICNEIRQRREAVVIDNVAEDAVYAGHHTPAMYGFQSYISMPITLADGTIFGTLCAIDPRPKRINTPEIVGMFRLFAELIAVHVAAHVRLQAAQHALAEQSLKLAHSQSDLATSQVDLATSRTDHAVTQVALTDEREESNLREQFIAVLGHDLRNPLAAISGGTHLLLKRAQDDKSKTILQMMAASVVRMSGLIDNVMDFARGRLGGGLTLRKERKSLSPIVTTVIDEISSVWPDLRIERKLALDCPFEGDHVRIGQLLSNLLGNAVTHGAADQPIRVVAATSESGLELSVSNGGSRISGETLDRLFQPFERGSRSSLQGLGLGLFIASQIAKAHGGTLDVASDDRETRFTFKAPNGAG